MSAPKLTAAQRARVRSLILDEGQSRAAATAWVLEFEPAPGARVEPDDTDVMSRAEVASALGRAG